MQGIKKKVVLKFGGAAIASYDHLPRICEIISKYLTKFDEIVVVISAMLGKTNELINIAHQISKQPKLREVDMLISIGERMSMTLLSIALNDRGIEAISLTGSQTGIITSHSHSEARIVDIRPARLIEALKKGSIGIVAGFQGVSDKKEVTTLGRGGSDTTAVALAAAIEAEEVHFYKDVDGVYSADPKTSRQATHFSSLSYDEALEIVQKGAKILHDRCLHLAKNNGILLRVFSFEKEKSLHTQIGESGRKKPAQPIYEEEITSLKLV